MAYQPLSRSVLLRWITAYAVTGMFLVAMTASRSPLQASVTPFPDVAPSDPNAKAIEYLHERGYVQGKGDGGFHADDEVTRAEFVKFVTAPILPASVGSSTDAAFPDVPSSDWSTPYLWAAKHGGIVTGYDDGTFRAGRGITMAEAAAIVSRAYKIEPRLMEGLPNDWYVRGIEALYENDLIPTDANGHAFAIDRTLQRRDMAEIMYRLLSKGDAQAAAQPSAASPEQTPPTTDMQKLIQEAQERLLQALQNAQKGDGYARPAQGLQPQGQGNGQGTQSGTPQGQDEQQPAGGQGAPSGAQQGLNEGACSASDCQPAIGMPNQRCSDGSIGGPSCQRRSDGTCGWIIHQCPADGQTQSRGSSQGAQSSAAATAINHAPGLCRGAVIFYGGGVSDDGRYVSFSADFDNLIDHPDGQGGAFVYDRQTKTMTRTATLAHYVA